MFAKVRWEKTIEIGVNLLGKVTNKELIQIGERIRFIRKCREMGQETLAEKAEVSGITISRIENGTTTMNVLILKKIAAALDVSVEEILSQGEGKYRIVIEHE